MTLDDCRVGHGYDVHRLVPGRKLILGGVEIPYSLGLLGHSDADVLFHAVLDALLGAMGEGDIGRLFPDTDPAFEGVSGAFLSEKVAAILSRERWSISNIDATVVAQKPKLAPFLPAMKKNIAAAFSIPEERVNLKATTEEGLGFTGTGEGIAAHAVTMIFRTL